MFSEMANLSKNVKINIIKLKPDDDIGDVKTSDLRSYSGMKDFDFYNIKAGNKFKYFVERFDPDILNYIIENFEELKEQLPLLDKDKKYDPYSILKKYMNASRDGKIKVKYFQRDNVGRYFATGALSLQNIKKKIRHSIAGELYQDIDLVNCHPVILLHLCLKNKIRCDTLTQYIINRDKILQTIGGNKNDAKQSFLSIMNGGDYNGFSKFLKKFKDEVNEVHFELTSVYFDKFQSFKKIKSVSGSDFNIRARFINHIVCDIENKILEIIIDFYSNIKDCVLCFDGLMIPKDINADIKKCEDAIYNKLGMNMKLKVKPMNEGFDLSNVEVKSYVYEKKKYYHDYKYFLNKDNDIEEVDEWLSNAMVLNDNGGNPCIITRNRKYDFITDQHITYFKDVKLNCVKNNLDIECRIINNNYDEEKAKEILEEMKLTGRKKMTKEQKRVGAKYLYDGELLNYINDAIFRRKINFVNNVDFIPYLKSKTVKCPDDTFNIFTGFPYDDGINKYNSGVFENSRFYNHLKNEIMNGDEGEFNHFLDFIADIIQQPANIRANPHLFRTAQGMGKGMLAFWLTKLVGINSIISFENIRDYFSNFNSQSSGKLIKIIEEVCEGGEAFNKANILKGHTAMNRERIEPKGIDAYTVNHYSRYIFFTNNDNALYIENDDRRYTLHRSNDRKANDIEYFKPIWDEVRDNEFCKECFKYFCNRKYDVMNVMTYYETHYKIKQKMASLSQSLKFLKEIIENNLSSIDTLEGKVNPEKVYHIKVSILKEEYKDWCSDNGCRYSISTLKTQWGKVDVVETRIQRANKRSRVYKIDTHKIEDAFKTYLKNPDFRFEFL